MSERGAANVVSILEIDASQVAYKSHIASEHFGKYKRAALHMVQDLKLVDQTPLNPRSKIKNEVENDDN